MRFYVVVFALVIAYAYASPKFNTELDEAWELFKKEFNKNYETVEHETHRRKIFEDNVKYINKHNSEADRGKHTFRVKINQFGDMHNDEFKKWVSGVNVELRKQIPESKRIYHVSPVGAQIPDSIDWRTQGYVTPIKNQEQCGSCWAFSATCALEGQHFKQSGKLVSLSEQNLVDCSSSQGNYGCNGGLMDQAFTYIIANKGIDTEDSYPYEGVDGTCRFNRTNVGATMLKFVDIPSGSEADLVNALATVGPIASAMNAGLTSFQFYSSGLYYDPQCTDQINHGINPVGYGSFGQGQDYYISKNMWGTSWGDKGYVYMARNRNNNCGIATAASYPIV